VPGSTSPAQPDSWNGELLCRAEQALRERLPATVLLRCAGLYGPGREWLLRRARAGEPGSGRWSNRLHVDDAAAAVAHLLGLAEPATLYNLVDDAPAPEWQVLADLRVLLGEPAVPLAGPPPPRGRRIANTRLRGSGWRPRFPDHRSGYAAVLREAGSLRV
jgi:nucleoside-diphosphate-sugar epimerase